MSIFGTMNTAASGMNAQSSRLAMISQNIENSSTTGYKDATTEFETLLTNASTTNYSSAGVTTNVRYANDQQGAIQTSATATNLAIQGNGYFVVSDTSGAPLLTRAGAFVPDAAGNLVNTAGYSLMGTPLPVSGGSTGNLTSLSVININTTGLISNPSTAGNFAANLPSTATVVSAANLPSANGATATPTDKTSIVAYDNLGTPVTLDVYVTNEGGNAWDVAVFNQSAAAAGGGFPYSAGPLSTTTLQFNPANGDLAAASAQSLSVAIPNGQSLTIDMSKMTQLASPYSVTDTTINGNAPSAYSGISIDPNGTLSEVYQDGTKVAKYQVSLADVPSPDNLTQVTGNAFSTNSESGNAVVGAPQTGPLGTLESSSLESSTVDIATELTNMIQTQSSYTANSKAFQTGADMMKVLDNLQI